MNFFRFFILILIGAFIFWSFPDASFAESDDVARFEVGIPGQANEGGELVSPDKYITFIYNFMIGLVGIAGFISLVWYGVVWIYSGISEKKAEAMEGIKNTLIGIGLALGSYVLLYTINPNFLSLDLPKVKKVETTNFSSVPQTEWANSPLDSGPGYYFTTIDSNYIGRYNGPYQTKKECELKRTESIAQDEQNNLNMIAPGGTCSLYKGSNTTTYYYQIQDLGSGTNPNNTESDKFLSIEACITASENAITSTRLINPGNEFKVGCYDNLGNFYDKSLNVTKPSSSNEMWAFSFILTSNGEVKERMVEGTKTTCELAKNKYAALSNIYSNVGECKRK